VGPDWPANLEKEGPGWNERSVLDAYVRRWPAFVRAVDSPGPFRASPEARNSIQTELAHHNATMVFGYALACATRKRDSVSMLDWGGGIGHYLLIARALVPNLNIDYVCRDLPILADHGATLFPEVTFVADDQCLERQYDFILASASLHYSSDWRATIAKLAGAAAGTVLLTRLPTVQSVPSYVFCQRPPDYGTEYPGWCLNRSDLIAACAGVGLALLREFDLGFAPHIVGAPEQNTFAGFLFRASG